MPRKTVPVLPPADYGDLIDADTLAPAVAQVRSTMGLPDETTGQIYVYLVNADGEGHDARVWDSTDPASFNLKTIAQKFGSGGYRVAVYMRDDSGINALRINNTQYIRLSPEDEAKHVAAREAAKRAPAPGAQPGGDMAALAEVMRAGFQSIIAAQQAVPPAPDPFTMLEKLGGILGKLQPAAPVKDTMSEFKGMLETMKTLKELTGGDAPSDASVGERLLLQAASTLMPALAQGAKEQIAAQAAPAQAPAAQEPAALPGPALSEKEQEEMLKLEFGLNMANRAAARGESAQAYASEIYDDLDDEQTQGLILNPQWFDLLCAVVSACAAHSAWYAAAREQIIVWALEDNLVVRDAAGNLTLPIESGTSESTEPPEGAATHGTVDAASASD